jgi:ribonuclease HII
MTNILKPYQNINKIELGIDEAGRGCLFGDLFIAGVIFSNNIDELINEHKITIKDSKKMSKKKRSISQEFIKKHALAYHICQISNTIIDEKNILKSTLDGMHDVVTNIKKKIKPDKLLIDGNKFNTYYDEDNNIIEHECIISGDNNYLSIAAASILAKTAKDEYIEKMCKDNPDLEKYGLLTNSGYGTKIHIDAIKEFGITIWHRKTYSICNEEKTKLKQEKKEEKKKQITSKKLISNYFDNTI